MKTTIMALTLLLVAAPAFAVTIYVESGGITLNGYDTSTPGGINNPWTINETMTSPGTLEFVAGDNDAGALGNNNATGTIHEYGKWFAKTVTNNTQEDWTTFELELQLEEGVPSQDGDGLSFADGGGLAFWSDEFNTYTRIDDVRDYLNFSGGDVDPGESVTFFFAITDLEHDSFYLLQTPNKLDTVPEPSTFILLGAGLGGLALIRRKSRK